MYVCTALCCLLYGLGKAKSGGLVINRYRPCAFLAIESLMIIIGEEDINEKSL